MTAKIEITTNAKQFGRESKDIQKSSQQLQDSLKTVGATAGIAFAGFATGIGAAVRQASNIEDLTTRFEVLTGSASKANEVIRDLQEFSAGTPFQLEGIARAGAQLLSFGVEAEKLRPTLRQIGDVAAASGSDLNELALIFGQVSASGRLTGERLLQFQERAIPIGPALAKSLGVAEESVRELVSQGAVDLATFQEAFASLSEEGGAAFGGLDRASATLSGQISTLKDNFTLLLAGIGEQFLPVIKQVTAALIALFQNINQDDSLKDLIGTVLAVGAALTGGVAALAAFGLAIPAVITGVTALGTVLGAVGGAIAALVSPIGLVVAAVAGLGILVATNFNEVKAVFTNFVGTVINLFSPIGDIILGALTFNLDKLTGGVEAAKEALVTGITATKEELKAIEEAERSESEDGRSLLEKLFLPPTPEKIQQEGEASNEALREVAAVSQEISREELQARREVDEERLKQERQFQQKFLKDKIQFGSTIASINQTINQFEVEGRRQTINDLSRLQQSSNETLKTIGKAAAVTQIGIDTAKGATSAYASLAGIPFVGPVLGAAAAGAIIAFGAEQTARVLSAQTGGIVPGNLSPARGAAGTDTVPSLLTPGELVVPNQSFDEVIDSIVSRRLQNPESEEAETREPQAIVIGFEGDQAANVLTARQVEDRSLGISQDARR